MNEKNYGEEEYFQDNYRNIFTNPLKNNQIKYKKRNIVIDREQLYSQNLQLKANIKQLMDLNLKMKTQLSIAQKQKLNLCSMAQEQNTHPIAAHRSQSGNHKKPSMINIQVPNQPIHFGSSLAKQKQFLALKKMIRDQTLEIQKLNAQNQKIKKTIKYTRMNQILIETKELQDQTVRLKNIIAQAKQVQNQIVIDYLTQIENLKRKLISQRDSEKRSGYELKKQIDLVNELKQKLRQSESKKAEIEKRLNKQIKQLRIDVSSAKSKLVQQSSVAKGKDCERQECAKILKQKNDLRKKVQLLQKQNKKLKDQNQSLKRKSFQLEFDFKKYKQADSKKIQKHTDQLQNSTLIKNQDSKTKNESSFEAKHIVKQQKNQEKEAVFFSKIQLAQQQTKQIAKKQERAVQNKIQAQAQKKLIQQPVSKKNIQINKIHENQQSIDTQKLLQSSNNNDNLKIQSKKILKQEVKNKQKQIIPAEKHLNNYKQESQGQYQALDYDEQEEQVVKSKGQTITKNPKKQVSDNKKDQKSKKKSQKSKEKQVKKSLKPQSEDQQILYRNQDNMGNVKQKQQGDDIKLQLKLIKETLVYKFMAHRYTYEDFCNDIKNSDMKNFSIAEVMSLLAEAPFVLSQEDLQIVIIYLCQKSELTGTETISTKNLIKKMKKFIGKAKAVDQETEDRHIAHIKSVIEKDERQNQKIRKKFIQLDDGQGFVNKQSFIKVMNQVGIKNKQLQTAISQIIYVSSNIAHLNYDFFLKRFTADVQ